MIDEHVSPEPGGDTPANASDHHDTRELPPGSEEPPDGSDADPAARALAECQDRLLRTAAEFDNFRKRTERERRELADRTVQGLLLDLLAVVDDLERALAAGEHASDVAGYRRGVELIHAAMLDLLRRRGVTPFDAVGTAFDPNVHQAVAAVPAAGRADGEVVEELRRGYMIGSILLRPAMVKVARS